MKRPREIMESVGARLIRQAPEAEGTVFCTKIALTTVEDAIRQLEKARDGLELRLRLIDRAA